MYVTGDSPYSPYMPFTEDDSLMLNITLATNISHSTWVPANAH